MNIIESDNLVDKEVDIVVIEVGVHVIVRNLIYDRVLDVWYVDYPVTRTVDKVKKAVEPILGSYGTTVKEVIVDVGSLEIISNVEDTNFGVYFEAKKREVTKMVGVDAEKIVQNRSSRKEVNVMNYVSNGILHHIKDRMVLALVSIDSVEIILVVYLKTVIKIDLVFLLGTNSI